MFIPTTLLCAFYFIFLALFLPSLRMGHICFVTILLMDPALCPITFAEINTNFSEEILLHWSPQTQDFVTRAVT